MKLVSPSLEFETSYRSYIKELEGEERYPFTLDIEYSDFATLLTLLSDYDRGANLPENAVPNSTLWLVSDGEIVGVTNIRHFLNEKIRHCGGHIGLSVRPSARGKGVGNELMRLSIDFLKAKGIRQIHVHCYKNNRASSKAILSNGGVLSSEFVLGEETVSRYIIND